MSYIKESAASGRKQFNVRLPSAIVDELDKLKAEVEQAGNELDVAALVGDGIIAGIKKTRKQLAESLAVKKGNSAGA